MDVLLSIIFFFSTCGFFHFFSRIVTWIVWKIAPENMERSLSRDDIVFANLIGILSISGYSYIFYNILKIMIYG